MNQNNQRNIVNLGVRGVASGLSTGLMARYIFNEIDPVNTPFGNLNSSYVIGGASAVASMISDITEKYVFDRLPINIQAQRFASFAVKNGLAGVALLVPMKVLIPSFQLDLENIAQTVVLGMAGKAGGDYVSNNIILKSERGFLF